MREILSFDGTLYEFVAEAQLLEKPHQIQHWTSDKLWDLVQQGNYNYLENKQHKVMLLCFKYYHRQPIKTATPVHPAPVYGVGFNHRLLMLGLPTPSQPSHSALKDCVL